jgi:hypothetical protein
VVILGLVLVFCFVSAIGESDGEEAKQEEQHGEAVTDVSSAR